MLLSAIIIYLSFHNIYFSFLNIILLLQRKYLNFICGTVFAIILLGRGAFLSNLSEHAQVIDSSSNYSIVQINHQRFYSQDLKSLMIGDHLLLEYQVQEIPESDFKSYLKNQSVYFAIKVLRQQIIKHKSFIHQFIAQKKIDSYFFNSLFHHSDDNFEFILLGSFGLSLYFVLKLIYQKNQILALILSLFMIFFYGLNVYLFYFWFKHFTKVIKNQESIISLLIFSAIAVDFHFLYSIFFKIIFLHKLFKLFNLQAFKLVLSLYLSSIFGYINILYYVSFKYLRYLAVLNYLISIIVIIFNLKFSFYINLIREINKCFGIFKINYHCHLIVLMIILVIIIIKKYRYIIILLIILNPFINFQQSYQLIKYKRNNHLLLVINYFNLNNQIYSLKILSDQERKLLSKKYHIVNFNQLGKHPFYSLQLIDSNLYLQFKNQSICIIADFKQMPQNCDIIYGYYLDQKVFNLLTFQHYYLIK